MTDEQFQCFKAKMTTSQGFREYKAEEALHYVQSRSPQELQQDFALLTPQTVQALSRLMSAFTQEDRSPGLSLQEVEKLRQDPPLFDAVDRFMSGEQHRDLRQLLLSLTFDTNNFENSVHSFQRYAFWSLKACHIPVE